ncbi:trypsin domain-containing protein [Ditylenchus destructor]|uniref:Trypsin domain-containing protein n=1 Tax=Ditylenchus destructor TaxID=166010 RepID=A0AAD4R336_9BILA|nr:trypsin domain-containing protein [Ditylenchus destructor]
MRRMASTHGAPTPSSLSVLFPLFHKATSQLTPINVSDTKLIPAELNQLYKSIKIGNFSIEQPSVIHERVIGGLPVTAGDKFIFSAVLAEINPHNPAERSALCGATFISRRHLVTAKHCLIDSNGQYTHPTLFAGGVCLMKDLSVNCPKSDMEKLDMYAIAYDTHPIENAQKYDFAIIILKKDVPSKYSKRIGAAVFEYAKGQSQSLIIGQGWGVSDRATQLSSAHQLKVTLSTVNAGYTAGCIPKRDDPSDLLFCGYSVDDNRDDSLAGGDSGSGAIVKMAYTEQYILLGILVSGYPYTNPRTGLQQTQSEFLEIVNYLYPICQVTGVCPIQAPDTLKLEMRTFKVPS